MSRKLQCFTINYRVKVRRPFGLIDKIIINAFILPIMNV